MADEKRKREVALALRYFWEEKGDLTRWVEFSRSEVAEMYPGILHAWDSYLAAQKLLDVLTQEAAEAAEDGDG